MSITEIQVTVIDPNAALIVVLKQAREGGVRFPDKGSACAWLKQPNACSFLFGTKPEMKTKFKAIKKDIHHPNKVSGVLMRLNRLWVNAIAWKAMELAQVSKEDCIAMSQALRMDQDTMHREMALDAIIAAVEGRSNKLAADQAAREAESEARHQAKLDLIQRIRDNVMDGELRNNLLYSKLNGFKQRQVDLIIDNEGMRIQLGQLQELAEVVERLNPTPPSGNGGARHNGSTKSNARARGEGELRLRQQDPSRKRTYPQAGKDKFKGGK